MRLGWSPFSYRRRSTAPALSSTFDTYWFQLIETSLGLARASLNLLGSTPFVVTQVGVLSSVSAPAEGLSRLLGPGFRECCYFVLICFYHRAFDWVARPRAPSLGHSVSCYFGSILVGAGLIESSAQARSAMCWGCGFSQPLFLPSSIREVPAESYRNFSPRDDLLFGFSRQLSHRARGDPGTTVVRL